MIGRSSVISRFMRLVVSLMTAGVSFLNATEVGRKKRGGGTRRQVLPHDRSVVRLQPQRHHAGRKHAAILFDVALFILAAGGGAVQSPLAGQLKLGTVLPLDRADLADQLLLQLQQSVRCPSEQRLQADAGLVWLTGDSLS